ncbi:hypothetical protein IC582_012898 [Cucumis melo]
MEKMEVLSKSMAEGRPIMVMISCLVFAKLSICASMLIRAIFFQHKCNVLQLHK